MNKRDEARYVPVETAVTWAWQADYSRLETLDACMQMLDDYGYRLTVHAMRSSGMLAIVDGDGLAQSVGDMDWIVFTGGEVKTVTRQAFVKEYRKFTDATK